MSLYVDFLVLCLGQVIKGFIAFRMNISFDDVTFYNLIPAGKLSNREFSELVTDNDVTNAVLMMYDDSAHDSFLLDV
ncbi:hypothetical protein A3466_09170 [Enterobacter genomosp. S]|uniref:Uncharacterized protein n=1 Tax=Enterobacter genomosp. S TaxID=2364151 RepID=A0ABR5YP00_9ENTR|nr:hypothetical protein A3466_09170 [Enterobacter genomosp. S]